MDKGERQALGAIPLILGVGAAIGWAGSQGSLRIDGWPVFALCGLLCFVVNWLVFIHAYLRQTERFFDLTGSLTYLSATAMALGLAGQFDTRRVVIGVLVFAWAARLGSFLFARITKDGSDGRFDSLKPSFARFLTTWTLQGLWVLMTLACALAAITSARSVALDAFLVLGGVVWLAGFGIEAIADHQKKAFRAEPSNRDRFIDTGLWAWSRHPNYFGEITLWAGVAIIALPTLSGWQYATLVSPVFVYFLLTRVSGVPLLEARGQQKWGDDPDYRAYCRRTPELFLRPPRAS
jgi:steroid 5-alpha reductase family enzyme